MRESSPAAAAEKTKRERSAAPGVIESDVLYTLDELLARARVGKWWMRQARKAGLKELRHGGRTFVFGRDFIAFLQQQEEP